VCPSSSADWLPAVTATTAGAARRSAPKTRPNGGSGCCNAPARNCSSTLRSSSDWAWCSREQRNALVGSTPNPRAELRSLISGERFDTTRAQALVDEKTNALRNGSPQTLAALAAFYDGLTPEQQQKLRDFMDKRGRGWRS
jgi:hypothetical protein